MNSNTSTESEHETLKEIMIKLVSISDVSGAAIVRADGTVISWHMENGTKPTHYIDIILDFMSTIYQKDIHRNKYGMFTQSILDFHGHKILINMIRSDVMLLLLLDKRAYLGLTMLDIEGYLREVDKALGECCSSVCETLG